MADTIIPNVVVSMPSQLFTLARSFKAAANGRIYIGKIDTDPTIPENQIPVYLENEDGSHVQIAQPITINSGGYPVYGGQIAKFVTVQGHSMAVYDALGVQQFYFPNVLKYDPDQFKHVIDGIIADWKSPNGYKYVGGFFSQETSGAYGNGSYDLVSWRGERGQFDQTQGIATQVTGAGVSFGGIQNRGMVVVGPGGALFSQLMLEGRPYSDLVASAYTIAANRLDAFGREVQVVKFPTKNNPTDNQCFELELYSDVNGQPKGVIRNQEKRTDLDNTGTTGDRALFIADEKLFATSSKFFAKIRIPDEVNRFSLDPIFGYRNFSSLTASNVLHIAVQSRFIYEITSMINSGNFYCYLSFRCRTNSNGNDTSKYGLYELAGNAQFAGGTVDGNAMYLHIANFLKDPDGKAANGANSPGTSSSTVCNYTDYQLYVCSEKLTPGTGLSDRYNGFLTNLSYGPVQTKAIRDVVSGYRPYTPTTVVTSINNGAAVTSTINAYNEGFVSRLDYDMSIRNDVNTLTVPFSTALGDYSGYDFAMRIFNRFGLKGYTV
ncbi:phage head-binding domain-containing protein [Serratia marcescens]|uniref:phage head-binding domain-containing protein n=1 Tax=Serratia marcescens TaxID=615 RepID=UPI00320479ED